MAETNKEETNKEELKTIAKKACNAGFKKYLLNILYGASYKPGIDKEASAFFEGQRQLAREILLLADALELK